METINIPTWEARKIVLTDYMSGLEKMRYVIDPEFQRHSYRNELWKSDVVSHLIRMRDLPPIYFHTKYILNGGTVMYECLDGRQRTEALKDFIENKYHLVGHQKGVPSVLKNKQFSDWPENQRAKFLEFTLNFQICTRELSKDEIADFFSDRQHASDTKNGERLEAYTNTNCYKWMKRAQGLENSGLAKVFLTHWGKNNRKRATDIMATCLYLKVAHVSRDPKGEDLLQMWRADEVTEKDFEKTVACMIATSEYMVKLKVPRQSDMIVFCAFFQLFNKGHGESVLNRLASSQEPAMDKLYFSKYEGKGCKRGSDRQIDQRYKLLLTFANSQ
jgi:hypothetical protein